MGRPIETVFHLVKLHPVLNISAV